MVYSTEGIHVDKWLASNAASFVPPVCNKLMYGDGTQHKVMFVGGPNVRKDYHLNEGEEMFYMIKGSMLLKVMEKGKPKDIRISEGQLFMLPGGVPHSPNRPEADSMGLVVERERIPSETDGVRWYVDESNETILYERWFHCTDLGTQLAPVIKGYFASEAHETRVPEPIGEPKFAINTTSTCPEPFNLAEWVASKNEDLKAGPVAIFEDEFKVFMYGNAGAFNGKKGVETWVWQRQGTSVLSSPQGKATLKEGECIVLPVEDILERSDDALMIVCQSSVVRHTE